MLVVDRTGPQALLQDLGRPGQAHLGVSPSGAADRTALRLANRLVGNPEGAAAIECLLGGLVVTARALHWVAVTGAPTDVLVNGVAGWARTPRSPSARATRWRSRRPRWGSATTWPSAAASQVTQTLGSRSTDLLSGLGPEPLEPGQELVVGRPAAAACRTPTWPRRNQPRKTLTVLPGPRRDWFTDARLADCC